MDFGQLGISGEMLEALSRNDIASPTLVQQHVIPAILRGKDVQTQSETGSGKTLGFAIPLIEKSERGKGIQVLVIAPTRELALQITEEFRRFSQHKRLNILTVYGGASINAQLEQVGRADIVVGTPGRILDLMRRGRMPLDIVRHVVLDEADRMLDMGFIEDIEEILRHTPSSRQTCLFSATLPDEIIRLSHRYLRGPVRITVKPSPKRLLDQFYYDVRRDEKFSLLSHLMRKERSKLNLIFCNTKRMADILWKSLRKEGLNVSALHGDMTQAARERTVRDFKEGRIDTLVATDVAARGLHIENISHVYNYDIPQDPITYIHRIGRTARVGASGKAISFISSEDYKTFSAVMGLAGGNIQKLEKESFPRLSLDFSGQRNRRGGGSRFLKKGPGRGWGRPRR